ncbi:MAG: Cobyric acid synthase [Firmicutes bacterium ADurb.Bin456]|nr:MAG: Cobyric acid synthase [Firmicutes bacterium ADurb.Bin456]
MKAKSIMIQGTASHVGKSVLVTALCRIFAQDGYRVAPFKSQNMALNSFVTKEGGEMGRAQAVQAEAAGVEPTVDMNPILLKPLGNSSSQVVILGQPAGNFSALQYHTEFTPGALDIIEGALDRLGGKNDLIVIEGAGSPAEVNLQEHEIVNMRIARLAGAPVLLVADVDQGGALASLVGTLELLAPEDRDRIVGFIINKFRGDPDLFRPAISFLEQKTGKPVIGVVPYFQDFRIQEEDTIPRDRFGPEQLGQGEIEIAVIHLPHISNFTDFDPLEVEPEVRLRYVGSGNRLGHPDLIILPGSKNTIEDLAFLNRSGLAGKILEQRLAGTPVIGICGGFQMLGKEINDPLHTESDLPQTQGLGLLEISTTFATGRVTNQVEAEVAGSGLFLCGAPPCRISGYEIHVGRTELPPDARPAFTILTRSGEKVFFPDGAVSPDGLVFGTYIHGIFDSDGFRRHIVNILRRRKGLDPLATGTISARAQQSQNFDKLAALVRNSLDFEQLYRIVGLTGSAPGGK